MTIVNNGLLLLVSNFTSPENNKEITFFQNSLTIINSMFIGALTYLGVMLPKLFTIKRFSPSDKKMK